MRSKNYKQNLSLWRVSIPFLFSILLSVISPIINTLILSLVPNNGAIYAESVGVSSQIYAVFGTIVTFATSGIGIVIGQQIGRKITLEELYSSIFTILVCVLVFSLVIFAIAVSISPLILLSYFPQGTQQYDNALLYIEVLSINLILATISGALLGIANSYGYTLYSVLISSSSIFLDLILTSTLVLFANTGILGSALGTIGANLNSLIWALVIFLTKVTRIKIAKRYFDKIIVKKLVRVSLPISLEKLNYSFSSMVLGIIVAQTGLKFADSFMIGDNTNLLNLTRTMIWTFGNLITVSSIAFGTGAEIIASRFLGSKDYTSTKKIVRQALIISLVIDLSLAITYLLVSDYVIKFFGLQNPIINEYFDVIKTLFFAPIILMIFLQLGRTFNIIYLAATRSSGDVKYNTIWSVIVTWSMTLLGFLLCYVFGGDDSSKFLYGLNGFFLAMALDEMIRGGINFMRWKSNKWMTFKLFDNDSNINIEK